MKALLLTSWLAALVGCGFQVKTASCAERLCPEGTVCSPVGDRCVDPAAIDACAGEVDGTLCGFGGATDGTCYDGVCTLSNCGDGVLDSSETCEGDSWQGPTGQAPACLDLGGDRGRISCSATCDIDLNTCEPLFWSRRFVGDQDIRDVFPQLLSDGSRRYYFAAGPLTDATLYVLEISAEGDESDPVAIPEVQGARRIWAAGESAVWVASASGLWFYDGLSWVVRAGDYVAVWGTGGDDVWAAPQGSSQVEHFDGSSWSTVNEIPEMEHLFVWGFAADDVFVGGTIVDVGTIYHFDGQAWTPIDLGGQDIWPQNAARLESGEHCIQGRSQAALGQLWCNAGDGWTPFDVIPGVFDVAVDRYGRLIAIGSNGTAMVYDGRRAFEIFRSSLNDLSSIVLVPGGQMIAVGDDGIWLDVTPSAWTRAPIEPPAGAGTHLVWSSEERSWFTHQQAPDTAPLAYEFDGFRWAQMALAVPPEDAPVTSVTGEPAGGVDGAVFLTTATQIWRSPSAGAAFALLAEYMGGAGDIAAAWAMSDSELYLVAGATLLHYTGTFAEPHVAAAPLRAIFGAGSSVFAVGDDGEFIRYIDGVAEVLDSGTSRDLRAIWAWADDFAIAGGSNGTLLFYDGNSVEEMQSLTTEHIVGLAGTGPGDIFALGADNAVLHFDGVAWAPLRTTLFQRFQSVAVSLTAVFFGESVDKIITISRPGSWSVL